MMKRERFGKKTYPVRPAEKENMKDLIQDNWSY
jgi:hypothetical protein